MTNGNQGNFFSGKAGNFVSGKETAECPAWGKTHFRMIGMKRLIPLIVVNYFHRDNYEEIHICR